MKVYKKVIWFDDVLGDVTIICEELLILAYCRHLWPFKREGMGAAFYKRSLISDFVVRSVLKVMIVLLKIKSYDLRLELVVTLRLPLSCLKSYNQTWVLKKNRCYSKWKSTELWRLCLFLTNYKGGIKKKHRVFEIEKNPLDYLMDGKIRER